MVEQVAVQSRDAEVDLGAPVAQGLPTVAFGLALVYASLTPAHFLLIPRPEGAVLGTLAVALSFLFGGLGLVWRRRAVSAESAPATFAGVCGVVLVPSALHLWLVPEPWNTTNFAAIIIGAGFFQLDRRWLVATVGVVWLTWAGLVVAISISEIWVHYFFLMTLSTAIGVAAHVARSGHLRGLQRVMRDLARSEERFRSLAECAPDAIIAIDDDSYIRFANPAVRTTLGWDVDELVGQPLAVLVPGNAETVDVSRLRESIELGLSMDDWRSVRLSARHRSGEIIPVEASFEEWSDGDANRFIGFIRNVSERDQAEKDRLALERRMQDTQRLESLGLLAGGIAHDFNNLLTPIIGHASVMVDRGSDTEEATEILEAGQRASQLTQQLLAYAGRAPNRRVATDLSEQVQELVRIIGSTLAESQQVELDLGSDLPCVSVDLGQLQQVVLNLLTNAIEASAEAGTIRVRTELVRIGADEAADLLPRGSCVAGEFVMLEVRDEGAGIAESVREHIFDPFVTTKGANRGLGLAAALGIVRGSEGGLRVESREGAGSSFQLFLPAAGSRAADWSEDDPDEYTGVGTVLVIDDEAAVRRMAKRLLPRLGFAVREAGSGEVALAQIEGIDDLAAIVLDLSMPGMGGAETLRELRKRLPGVPILLSSGYDASDGRATGHDEPGIGFLQKPYQIADLSKALRALLEGKPGRG